MRFVGIDLSTKTGLVILDRSGDVLVEKEITSKTKTDPERMIDLTEQVLTHIQKDDIIAIEGFSYGSRGRGMSFQFGFGYAIRIALYQKEIPFILVSPGQVKKFATGKGNTSKDNMILPIYKKWGFEHSSDNVRDAYVLAQIARYKKSDMALQVTKYQLEVLSNL